jgi:catecholate siderophore receptor
MANGRQVGLNAFLIAAGIAPAHAQEDIRSDPPMAVDRITVVGERFDYGDDSISSATKTDTPLIDIPQSVTVITDDFIKDQGMRSMADLVRYVPGVSIGQGEGHRDAPTLRGNSTTADFYVNGVRDDVQYFRDLYNVERVEVLKGPNAMIFGRGGGGGVINRVTEKAGWDPLFEVQAQGGSYGFARGAVDAGGPLSDEFALRLNGVYENSDSYRDFVGLERFGVNPTATVALSGETRVLLSYEYFQDHRTVDRGVPSQNQRPYAGSRTDFVGNPDLSFAELGVHLASATFEHEFSDAIKLRNHTSVADYDKFYQNVHANSPVKGPGNTIPCSMVDGSVCLQAYNSATTRQNVFNQTDLTIDWSTGSINHKILFGFELGHQETDNFRTANVAPSVVNIANPTTFAPVVFGGVQTDNRVNLGLAGVYFQDQIEISEDVLLIGGVRFDHFNLDFDNHLGADFSRVDNVVSPRGGVIVKPLDNTSLYFSYSQSFLPQSGDQFGSLTVTTEALKPERFENLEAGFKWDIIPTLAFTAAVYRLDRDNTTAIDPMTMLTVLTGSQRSKGVELGLVGAITEDWEVVAGYAYQDAKITSTTTAAPTGREIPLVPEHSFSLWTAYQVTSWLGAGVGVTHQTDMFASIGSPLTRTTLPGFTRVDAAIFLNVSESVELQLNIENLLDETYWPTAHNDNNITPGSPRAFRGALTVRL